MQFHHSETYTDLAKALCKAQGEFDTAKKDKLNPHLKSPYADITSIANASRPALVKNGLLLVQTHEHDNDVWHLHTTIIHAESGQWLATDYPLHVGQQNAQGFAAATTYARRVSWQTICGVIAELEDDDGNETADTRGVADEAATRARAAYEWSRTEIDRIRKMTTDELDKWVQDNTKTLQRAKAANGLAADDVVFAIENRRREWLPVSIDTPKPQEIVERAEPSDEATKFADWFQRKIDDLALIDDPNDLNALDEVVMNELKAGEDTTAFMERWAVAVSTARRRLRSRATTLAKGATKL